MSTVEVAAFGLAALLVANLAAALLGARGRYWGLCLTLAGFVYFIVGEAGGAPKKWLTLVLGTVWGLHYTAWTRHYFIRPSKRPLRRAFPREVFELFLASAPLLAVQTDPSARALTWWDGLAVVLGCGGLFWAFQGRRTSQRRQIFQGEVLLAWSMYVLALPTQNGLLTVFSPLIFAHHLRQSLDPARSSGTQVAVPTGAP